MIVEIRIEANQVVEQVNGNHLYIVGVDEFGQELVLRGGPGGPTLFNPTFFGDINVIEDDLLSSTLDARDPSQREQFDSMVIDLGGRNPDDVWNIMLQHAGRLNELAIDYDVFFSNSKRRPDRTSVKSGMSRGDG